MFNFPIDEGNLRDKHWLIVSECFEVGVIELELGLTQSSNMILEYEYNGIKSF